MPIDRAITFVSVVNSREIFDNNFLASPCFQKSHGYQILVQENFTSAANAYNDAINRSANDLIVFAHQDMVFPETWIPQLERALTLLDATDPNWGVLGCYGITVKGEERGFIYSNGIGVLGTPFEEPAPVQTLDEIVLIVKKSSGLRFDGRLNHFHFYGADICMEAMKRGMKSYAIPGFCIHNTQFNLVLPKDFYNSYRVMKSKWKESLPIQTTCIRLSKFDGPLYLRRLKEMYLRYIRRHQVAAVRIKDGRGILESLRSNSDTPVS
jgi:Glycosyltransferase like family